MRTPDRTTDPTRRQSCPCTSGDPAPRASSPRRSPSRHSPCSPPTPPGPPTPPPLAAPPTWAWASSPTTAGAAPRAHRRHPDRGRGRLRPPGQRLLVHPLEQRRAVGLHQGHRGDVLHQPLLRPAVQRLLRRRHDPRRLPLRDPGHDVRRRPGRLLRRPRRRLVPRRQDPAGHARHRMEPVRGRLLRQVGRRDGELDPGLPEPVHGAHRPGRRALHGHELVDAVHRRLRRLRCHQPLWIARYASSVGTLPAGWSFQTMWQYTSSGPTVGDHDKFNGALDRVRALANG